MVIPDHADIRKAYEMAAALDTHVRLFLVKPHAEGTLPVAFQQVSELAYAAAALARCLATLDVEFSPEMRRALDPLES